MEAIKAGRPPEGDRVRVLVVDDSAVARDLIMRGLSFDPGIEVVGQAADAWAARDAIIHLSPDVVTLDVEMPRMDGIDFLRRLMPQYPIPVVIVSAVTAEGSRRALDALEAGALEVVGKPAASDREGLRDMLLELAEKVKAAAKADHAKLRTKTGLPSASRPAKPPRRTAKEGEGSGRPWTASLSQSVVAIGASTGGTAAIMKLLSGFPEDCPPTLVVQHMPPVFTAMFAASLDKISAPTVREAVDAQRLERGLVLVGAGDRQLRLEKDRKGFFVRSAPGPKVSGHCPSVDVLFESVAKAAGPRAVGILLTGMGRDGADGLLSMRRAGGRCLAQDEASSVVFGMPQEAWRNGAAERLVALDRAAVEILACAARIDQDAMAGEKTN